MYERYFENWDVEKLAYDHCELEEWLACDMHLDDEEISDALHYMKFGVWKHDGKLYRTLAIGKGEYPAYIVLSI